MTRSSIDGEGAAERLAGMLDQPSVERVHVEGVREPARRARAGARGTPPSRRARRPRPTTRPRPPRPRVPPRSRRAQSRKRALAVFGGARATGSRKRPSAPPSAVSPSTARPRPPRSRARAAARSSASGPRARAARSAGAEEVRNSGRAMYRADRNAPIEASTHASSRPLVAANLTMWSFAKKPASGGMPARAARRSRTTSPRGHLRAQSAHPPHVGLVFSVHHVAAREEEQGLVERVADEQQHRACVEAHPGREEHEPDLAIVEYASARLRSNCPIDASAA